MKNKIFTIFALLLSNFYFSQTYTLNSASSGTTISTCTGTFVDDGGSGVNYSNNQNTTITFCPATPGDIVKISFTSLTLKTAGGGGCQDVLDVYQGNAAYAAPLITAGTPDDRLCGAYAGTNLPVFYATSSTGCITFNFISDGSGVTAGWTATITCVTPCTNPTAALVNSSIVNICGPNSNSPGSLTVNFDGSNSTLGAYGPGGSTVTLTNYQWTFGDGTSASTSTATTSHTYPSTPGVYVMRLSVKDNNTDVSASGCSSTNSVIKIIRVIPAPTFTGTTVSPQNIGCGSNATLTGVATSQTETQNIPAVNGVTVALPDGSGGSFTSNADFSGLFPAGATMTSGCYPTLWFNLEHSYTGDLTIDLISPSGQTVRVFNRHGVGGMFGPIYMFGTCVDNADDGVPGCGATYSVANSGGQSWINYGAAAITTTNSTACSGYTGTCYGATSTLPLYTPTLYNSTNSFTALNGSTMNGVWQIKITDNLNLDDGFLFGWGLVFPPSCYTSLESVTPSLTNAVWTNGGSGPAVPVAQTTTSITVTDPGPDACPVVGTCTGNKLTDVINFGVFNTPGSYPYLYTATDQFGCTYTNTVTVAVSCTCPSLTALSYGGPFCQSLTSTQTPTVSGSGAISSGVYSSIPVGLSINAATGVITPSLSTANTYTVTYLVTPSSGTCTPISTNTVVVINATPTITVNSPTICSGTSTVLTANGGTTYSWTPGTNLSATTGSTVTANPLVTMVYSVTGTTNGCSATNSSTVTVNPTPTITVNSPTICSGTSTVLTANGGLVGTTYSWSPGTSLSATTGSAVTSSATTTIQYTVTATLNGCSGAATSTLTVNATPTITVNSPTICSGISTVLIANGGTTYSWTPGTNLNTTTGSTVIANPTVTTIYSITGTTNGCSSTNTSTVTVKATPTITVNSPTICSGTSTVLTANGGAIGTSYTWTPGTSLSTTTGSVVTSSATTTIQYTVTATLNGCSGAATSTITVNSIPTTSAITNGTINCNTPTISLTSTLSGMSYTWTAPAGGSITTATTQNTSAFGGPGTYSLFVQSAAGCTFSTTTSVTQSTTAPTAVSAGPNQTLGCGSGTIVTLSGSATTPTNATAVWSGPSVSGSTTSFTTTANGAGIYTLTATNPLNGCTAVSNVTVAPNAGAPAFTINPVTNSITCTNTLVTVSISSTVSPATYSWSGTGITSGNGTGTITVNQGGTFNFTLTNTTNSCTASNNTVVVQNTTIPTTTATTTGVLTCSTPTIDLNSSLPGMSYTWTAPAGGSVSTSSTQATIASGVAGTYSLTVIDPANGCQFTTTTSVTQNTTAPTTTVTVSDILTCSVVTVNLNSSLAGMSYTWTTPIPSTVNVQSISTSIAGNYTLTLVDPSNGCSTTTITPVTQNTVVPTLTLSPLTTNLSCTTSTVQLMATTTDTDVSYAWITNGSLSNNTISNPIATGSGTYNIVVTNTINGCQAAETATVTQNTTPPTLTLSPMSPTLSCVSNTVQLTAITTDTDVSYAWTTNGSLSNTAISNPIATGSGTYNVIVTNTVTGCQANATATITQNITSPTLTLSPMSFTLSCVSSTVQLTAITTDTDVSYAWTTNGSLSSTAISNPIATGTGTYNVIVTNTVTGCQANKTATVTQNTTPPTLTLSPMSYVLTCATNTVQLMATTTDTDVAYSWTTNGSLSSSTISNPIATGTGTYNIVVTNTVTGCQANKTATVTSNLTPPTLTLNPMSFILTCSNPTVQLTATTTDTDVAYSWTTNGSLSNTAISNPIATGSGTYNVIVTNTLSGCQANKTATLTSNTTPPSVSVVATNTVIPCGSPSVVIGASSTATNVAYNWTTSGTGSILSVTNMSTAVAGSAGQYIVTVNNIDNGCTNTGTVNVTSTGVTAAFTANPMSGTAPLLVNFTNQSTGTSLYSWSFSDNNNNTSTSTNPSHIFNTTGSYIVTLVATDASSLCIATATLSIEVFENSSIIIPNVFTPNGDGSNDLFKITSTGLKDLTCDIFNRWGTKLFTIKSVNDSWDGSGAADGTYFFILQATGFDSKEFKQQGFISLFR